MRSPTQSVGCDCAAVVLGLLVVVGSLQIASRCLLAWCAHMGMVCPYGQSQHNHANRHKKRSSLSSMDRSITSSLILEGAEFPRVSTQPQLVSPGAFAFNDKQGVVSSFLSGRE